MGGPTSSARALTILVLALSSAPLAAQEPPGAWFLNAHGTGGDYVYFSVGGNAEVPPQDSREVLLGWSWDDAGTAVERYPGSVPARYRPSSLSGKQSRQWYADVRRSGIPRLGIGPGRELLLLGDDERTTELAMRWAEVLDSAEAAYRHSSPDLAGSERRGVIEIGQVGRCTIRSVPVEGRAPGWSTLRLPGHARPSRSGGYYYVDPFEGQRVPRRPIDVQRFLRVLDGPGDCGGRGLDLSLMPAPREEDFHPPYFVVLSGVELRPSGFLDLEPTPRSPAVRTLARIQGTAREQINIASWPAAGAQGVDLCRAPFMETLCLKDLRIREQLATATVADRRVAGPLVAGCRDFFDRLDAVPSPHPCTDPGAWRSSVGVYRTGYTGDLVLRERPGLKSRMNAAGEVQWLWTGSQAPDRTAVFPLADGTRIELDVPRTAPPAIADRPPQPVPSAPPTETRPRPAAESTAAESTAPESTAPESTAPEPTAPDSTPPRPAPGTATDPAPPPAGNVTGPRPPAPGTASDPQPPPGSTVDPAPPPSDTPAETRPAPPGTSSDPPPSGTPTGPPPGTSTPPPPGVEPTPPPGTVVEHPPAGAAIDSAPPTDSSSSSTSPESNDPSGTVATPAAAWPKSWLWLAAALALAMATGVALLLRSQRTSARVRRQGLVAEGPDPDFLLDQDDHGERLLAGRDSSESTPELLLEPPPPTAPPVVTEEPIEPPEDRPEEAPEPATPPEVETVETAAEPEPESSPEEPPPAVLPLEPPELAGTAPAAPAAAWRPLAREWSALEPVERQAIHRSLAATSRLGEWAGCLLPVLDDLEHGRGGLPALDHLPPAARKEWRQCRRAVREFAEADLAAVQRLGQGLVDPDAAPAPDRAGAQYLSDTGLLDPEAGSLAERLRRHLLQPGSGRLQELVVSLQYLIEAFPVEHLGKPERKAYLGAVRRRLEDRGLSGGFHQLVAELASGLGLRYRQARCYRTRASESGNEFLEGRQSPLDLSQRVGYPADADDGVVVRLSELFLTDSEDGAAYSGRAWIDGA